MKWKLIIEQIETKLCVGIAPQEQNVPQVLQVSAEIWAEYPAKPASIDECVDYGLLYDLVVHEWPKRPQVELLETLAMELYAFIFAYDARISDVQVTIKKPDVLKEIDAVGISSQLSRAEFEAL